MKKKNSVQKRVCFPYKFTSMMILLAIGILVLCALGIAVSIYRLTQEGLHEFTDFLRYPLLIIISAFCIIVVICLLVKSQYVVSDKDFIVQFGFIKNKYPIKNVTALSLDSDTAKLSVYLGEPYVVLSIEPTRNDAFVKAVREFNPNAEFTFTMASTGDKKQDE